MKKIFFRTVCLLCVAALLSLTLASCKKDSEEKKSTSDLHTVTFNSNGGTYIPDVEVRDGQKATAPTPPTRDNYIFLYWEYNDARWDFAFKPITEDITLNAHWISAISLFDTVPAENSNEILISGFASQKSIKSLSIPEKINGKTVVGFTDGAMSAIHDAHASHIIIPETVTTVGDGAFMNVNLVHLEFEGELSTLGESSFENCVHLEHLRLGKGLTTIPYRCFFGATGLAAIDIPEGVTVIEENAFSSCSSLQLVVLPSTLEVIEDGAFLDSDLSVIFFKGTSEQFDALSVNGNNDEIAKAKVFFYSETEPEKKGDFWHYDAGNSPVLW